jgi:hypothetical protein
MIEYRVVIADAGRGRFLAQCGGVTAVSRDPEHAICREIVAAGWPDGPVAFVHGPSGMVAMRAKSVFEMAKWSIHAGSDGGFVRRPFNRFPQLSGSTVDGDSKDGL